MNSKILRVLDVNFNRSKEGLRVVEDIFRFIIEDNNMRKKIRRLRHSLDRLAGEKFFKEAIKSRDPDNDLGKKTDILESKRKNYQDILYINLQRTKESLRVLEEFFKIVLPSKTGCIKKLRYEVYTLEKQIIVNWSDLLTSA